MGKERLLPIPVPGEVAPRLKWTLQFKNVGKGSEWIGGVEWGGGGGGGGGHLASSGFRTLLLEPKVSL